MDNGKATHATSAGRSAAWPVIVLVLVCVVAGCLLGAVHVMTAPVIARVEEERANQTYAALIPDAATFEPLACDAQGCTAAMRACDKQGATLGYVIVAQSKGYGGPVPLAVAFDTSGTVMSIQAMSNEETPGLGTRIAEEPYIGQYVGKPAKQLDASEVDLISGATISSKAALQAFNNAVAGYEEVSQ